MRSPVPHLAFALAFLATRPLRAQDPPFKVGDAVEVQYAGQWTTGIVTKELTSGTYVVNHGNQVMYINAGPANIRRHQLTPAEEAEARQSAAALARRPTGSGIGAQYGAREPTTCASRTAPPTAANVRQYVLCGMEGVDAGQNLLLVTNLTVQVGRARAFLYQQDARWNKIDVRAPVIDIRGGYKLYQCGRPNLGGGAFAATHNCTTYDQPVATGTCYQDTFGDWHCALVGNRLASSSQVRDQMPPTSP